MDTQTFFNSVFFGLIGIIGVLGKIIFSNMETNIKNLQKEVHELDVLVAGDYVKKEEYKEDINRVFDQLQKINEKLSSKADR